MSKKLLAIPALLFLVGPARADDSPDPIRAAVDKGLRRIEQGSTNYLKHRQCFSCHHQAVPILSLTSARKRGFAVAKETIQRQIDFSLKTFQKKEVIRKGQGIGGSNTTVAYALTALAAVDHPRDETTAALVEFLLVRQRKDGAWPAVAKRPPSEGSPFTATALALLGLRKYGPDEDTEAGKTLRRRIDAAFAKGRDWLLANQPESAEDKIFRLRGLVHAGADPKQITFARDLLLKDQKSDGSWAQVPDRPGDAYATGAAMVALRLAGLVPDNPAYARGVKFLVQTQNKDGSWIVATRSRPIQVFFDNGDPGDKSQFISFTATGWAVQALLEAFPPLVKAEKP
jgi:N-acyl-D-amino-acid deacylase